MSRWRRLQRPLAQPRSTNRCCISSVNRLGPTRRSSPKSLRLVTPAIESTGRTEAWIIDDTSFPKKGKHSVGVARQYSGQLGKQDNCQVAVSLSIANDAASLPVAYRLYLPQDWANDPARRQKVGVPEDVVFKTKPMIALDQITAACDAGLPQGVVLNGCRIWCRHEAAFRHHRARA